MHSAAVSARTALKDYLGLLYIIAHLLPPTLTPPYPPPAPPGSATFLHLKTFSVQTKDSHFRFAASADEDIVPW